MDTIKSIKSYTKKNWVVLASFTFILINALLVIGSKHTLLFVLPALLLFLIVYILYPLKFYLAYLLISPLSIPLSEIYPNLPFDLWLPSELMLVALAPVAFYMLISENFKNLWFSRHPILLMVYFFMGWLTISTITSTIPLVSVKYLLLKALYLLVLFYLPFVLITSNTLSFKKIFLFYAIGLLVVIAIALTKQWESGLFNKFAAHGSCNPFFTDHTSYAASIALLFPVSIALTFSSKSYKPKIIFFLLALVLLIAIILSYTRAAWLSIMVAGALWVVWLLKIRFRYIALVSLLLLGSVLHFQNDILIWLDQNKTTSSADLHKHISSIANIRTDVSNVERINRWTSAIRMFEEKPIFGWGPGTYMFQYAPYQASYLKTSESSNLGLKGNAHSEYLGLLSEAGLPAALAFISIIVLLLYKGFYLISKLKPKSADRIILTGVLFGLITYVVHGILNNFLDMDKVAVLFWGYAAQILAMDYRYSKSNPNIEISSNTSESDSRS